MAVTFVIISADVMVNPEHIASIKAIVVPANDKGYDYRAFEITMITGDVYQVRYPHAYARVGDASAWSVGHDLFLRLGARIT